MKLFYMQSPIYWRNLYSVAENLNIEAYEVLTDYPPYPTQDYNKESLANKICLWDEEKYGSDAYPHDKMYMTMGMATNLDWFDDNMTDYKNKIKKVLKAGDDVVLAVTDNSSNRALIQFFQSVQTEYNLRLHFIVWADFPTRTQDDSLLVPFLSYLKTASSVVICNSHDLCPAPIFSVDTIPQKQNRDREELECNALFLDTADGFLRAIKQHFEGNNVTSDELFLYEFDTGSVRYIKISEIEFREAFDSLADCMYETVTPGLNHDNCIRLKGYRNSFAEKYGCKHRNEIDERNCNCKASCRGVCKACDLHSENLFLESTFADGFKHYDLIKDDVLSAPINGINRMRIDTDGTGVRSLILMDTCYLNCKYCINKKSINRFPLVRKTTVLDLAWSLQKDIPYFAETDGGVTFGGGEPLLYSDFIHQFHTYMPAISINVETSLNVEQEAIKTLIDDVSEWIIDIKDMNPDIYYQYTDAYNDQVIDNLNFLLNQIGPDRILCRVPLIKGYNTPEDVEKSVKQLENMGFTRIERFEYV